MLGLKLGMLGLKLGKARIRGWNIKVTNVQNFEQNGS